MIRYSLAFGTSVIIDAYIPILRGPMCGKILAWTLYKHISPVRQEIDNLLRSAYELINEEKIMPFNYSHMQFLMYSYVSIL